jgi:hypothetical protein
LRKEYKGGLLLSHTGDECEDGKINVILPRGKSRTFVLRSSTQDVTRLNSWLFFQKFDSPMRYSVESGPIQ